MLLKPSGLFLLCLLLLLLMNGFQLDPGILDVSHRPTEIPYLLRHATFGTMILPSGPTEFGSYFKKPGLPPISCPTIGPKFQQLQPLLILGGFPMDRGPLSPCLNQDFGNYCPVTEKTRQNFILREDLYDELVRMYDDGSPNHIMVGINLHLPHVRVSTKFLCEMDLTLYLLKCLDSPYYRPQMCRVDLPLPQPLSGQAYVALQPWPPPMPTNSGFHGLFSAVKPVVYSPLPEGFKGEGK